MTKIALLFLALLSCLASPALAQAPLDWTDGGVIDMPSLDIDGDAYPAATPITCDVQVAGTTIRVSSTVGASVLVSQAAVPKGTSGSVEATASCTVPLSAEPGEVATAMVSLRPWRGPRAPALRP